MRVALLGVGLIGGSIGLAARRRLGAEVIGFDPDSQALSAASRIGAIDAAASSVEVAVAEADLVFAAAPVATLPKLVADALSHAAPGCIVSDVGSTKRDLLAAVAQSSAAAGSSPEASFVGGHPLAGAEQGGVERAREDLFDGAVWFLTPATAEAGPNASEAASALIARFVAELGGKPVEIDPDVHDLLLARISHLPHVLANLLVDAVASGGERDLELALSGPSFRDATRVAGANTEIWTDIYLANADKLILAIDELISQLGHTKAMLQAHDRDALTAWNELAHARRHGLESQ